MRNLSYENEFCMQFHFHANQNHFHKNGFALRLALKQRHEGTRKWPIQPIRAHITTYSTLRANTFYHFHWSCLLEFFQVENNQLIGLKHLIKSLWSLTSSLVRLIPFHFRHRDLKRKQRSNTARKYMLNSN